MFRIMVVAIFVLTFLTFPASAQESFDKNSDRLTETSRLRQENGKEIDGNEPAGLINSSSYAFSAQAGVALEDMSGGTTLLLGSNQDNDSSAAAPIRNAIVTLSGGGLPAPVVVQTGQLGTYGFSNLQAGETYTIQVSAKRFRFTPSTRQVTPMGNLADVDFVANPPEEF